jgi:uncharacterized protein (TIGR02246 family)
MRILKHTTKIFGLFLFSLCMSHFALAAEVAKDTKNCVLSSQEIASFFTQWNNAIQTENPDTVTALYAEDAVLLPTISNTPRTNHTEMRAYFVDFLKKKPRATIDRSFIKPGCNWATDTGIYSFNLTDEKSKKVTKVQARYSFVYEKIKGKWTIIHHHSSLMPEKEDEKND